jgi:glycosyltransferase involved in cell wall biosynthesis
MNILFIAHYADLYGANRSLLALVRGLQEKGDVNCRVLVPAKGRFTEELDRVGIAHAVHAIPWWFVKGPGPTGASARIMAVLRWLRAEWRAVGQLRQFVRQWNIDVVHSNSSVVATGALLALVTGRPHVWHLREFGTLDYDLRPLTGMRMVRFLLRSSDRVICVSRAIRTHFGLQGNARASVVFNGVVPRAAMGAPRQAPSGRPFIFSMIGVVSPYKGHAEAFEALARVVVLHPDTELHVVGEGALQEARKKVAQLGLGTRVVFHGYVNDVAPLLARTDVLLMCSRNEAMGRVTAEAMCAGVPVIGHDSGGTPELVHDGVDGLLYPGGAEALAGRMLQLMEQPEAYELISRYCLNKAATSFTNEAYVEAVHQVYRSLKERATAG